MLGMKKNTKAQAKLDSKDLSLILD